MFIVALVVVLVLILIYYINARGNAKSVDGFITGCWIAPDDFCKSVEVESLMMVFGEPEYGAFSVTRECYIVIMDNMIKSSLRLEYSIGTASPYHYTFWARPTFDDGPDWGDLVKIHVDVLRGSMEISGDRDGVDTVYARMYRQNDISSMFDGIFD